MSFATVEQLKKWLTIDPSRAADEEFLQQLLDSATSSVCTYCSRSFQRKEYTDMIVNKGNGRYILLDNYPVKAVSSVKINGKEIAVTTSKDAFGYTFDEYGVRLIGYVAAKGDWVEIIYEAGLDVIPADLVHCVLEIAGLNYKEKDRIGISSKTVQTETVKFTNSMPSEVKAILNQYRRVRSMR